ncbi:MAG: DMT family transporter [Planctomycetaceae bacterium]|jgi:drug/metabolite transporter (DMT)-like permease|nr:DMT family transporter [Planctomycetaceae bacterium]
MDNGEWETAASAGKERWIGTVFALLSTTFYGVSNVVMRYLADCRVDLDWILCYKEIIGLSLLIPWLLFRLFQGRLLYISKRLIVYVIIASIICELIGSHLQLLGYAVIGLIIAVPLIQSATLLGVAILGYTILGDPLSRRRKIAVGILIAAVTILSVGKAMTGREAEVFVSPPPLVMIAVAAGAFLAGVSFSVYIIILRYVIRRYWKDEHSPRQSFSLYRWVGYDYAAKSGTRYYSPFPVTLMMAIVFAVGIVIFSSFLYAKSGPAGFYNVPAAAWYLILLSGITNAAGFFFQIQGLRMTTAVQASLVAVCQIVMLSFIGYLFFNEAVNVLVIFGLVLTSYGVIMSAKPEK